MRFPRGTRREEGVGVVRSREGAWEACFPTSRIDRDVHLPCFDIGVFDSQENAAR